ncbi:unnamed protein product [Arctia plantaginis]|uniref:Uncharacterized protein n=1 Tax=Arctia plantaginis TaxID=874455 RepID=A0A8S0YLU9_ARCPL|nr:unnamed protein product [Arctia plantaginis]
MRCWLPAAALWRPTSTYHRRFDVSAPPRCRARKSVANISTRRRAPDCVPRRLNAQRCAAVVFRARSRRAGGARRRAPGTLPLNTISTTHTTGRFLAENFNSIKIIILCSVKCSI